jgi:ABC-type glutathione transport system ATPase component
LEIGFGHDHPALKDPRLEEADDLKLHQRPLVVREREAGADAAELERPTGRGVVEDGGNRSVSGPAEELARRPDLLRAVFLDGGETTAAGSGSAGGVVDRSAAPALELAGVVRRFGGNVAVDAVDLRVQPGEIVGLVGQNGAGKTTLIDLVSGLQPLDGGTICLGGTDLAGCRPSAGRNS